MRDEDPEYHASQLSFFNADTEERLRYWEDPRLAQIPMPPGWVQMPREPTNGSVLYTWPARNEDTGEIIHSDPRHLPEALAERGVPIKTISLV